MSTTTPAQAAPPPGAGSRQPQDWVPVERRWFGFDRWTAPYAGFVAGVIVLMHFVFPAVNASIDYDNPVRVGDTIALQDRVMFQPEVGWNIEQGFRSSDDVPIGGAGATPGQAKVSNGDVSFAVTVASFDGTPAALLSQIRESTDALNDEADFHVVGDPAEFTTSSGTVGRISRYASRDSTGILAALTQDGVGVEVVATSADEMDRETVTAIAGMLASLSFVQDGAS